MWRNWKMYRLFEPTESVWRFLEDGWIFFGAFVIIGLGIAFAMLAWRRHWLLKKMTSDGLKADSA
jgi:hypothetical protein